MNENTEELIENDRSNRLLELVNEGINRCSTSLCKKQLGNRQEYIGLSDVGAYLGCPRAAMLNKFSDNRTNDLEKALTLIRGHWFEDGIAEVLKSLKFNFVRQLSITQHPLVAHLDFVLVSEHPKPSLRILEVKSMKSFPDTLYPNYEVQVYGQVSMLKSLWNSPAFGLKRNSGRDVFNNFTFPEAAKKLWGIDLPKNPEAVDIEAWVLALTMTNAKVYGPYLHNTAMLDLCTATAGSFWNDIESAKQGNLKLDKLPVAKGLYPLCSTCLYADLCPKFSGLEHPELEQHLQELSDWKKDKTALDEKIKEKEADIRFWYENSASDGSWITTGKHRFKMSDVAGRTAFDKTGFANELLDYCSFMNINLDVSALFSRHEAPSAPSRRLTISTIKQTR